MIGTLIHVESRMVIDYVRTMDGIGYTPPNGTTVGPEGGKIGQLWTGQQYEDTKIEAHPNIETDDHMTFTSAQMESAAKHLNITYDELLSVFLHVMAV